MFLSQECATRQSTFTESDTRLGERSDEAGQELELEAAPLDKSYVQAIKAGLPPTGGWGCGVERLVMLFSGANRISDCLSFGSLRNVIGLTSGASPEEASAGGSEDEAGGSQRPDDRVDAV